MAPKTYTYTTFSDKKCSRPFRNDEDSVAVAAKEMPAWSPDGKCLTYVTTRPDRDIYIVFGMDEVLKDPDAPTAKKRHKLLIQGEGDQKAPAWCPVPSAGVFAYVNNAKDENRYEVRVYDAKTNKAFRVEHFEDLKKQFLSPSWSPNGKWLAYYQDDIGRNLKDAEKRSRLTPADTMLGSHGLGLASVELRLTSIGDSIVIKPQKGNHKLTDNIKFVGRNDDSRLGPAWLPDDNHLLVSEYVEEKHNPLKLIDLYEWRDGAYESDWLKSIEPNTFQWPREISTVNRNVTFTYAQGQKTFFLIGQIDDMPPYTHAEPLPVSKERRAWWGEYSITGKPNPGKGVVGYLVDPVGPDILINRPIVLIPAAVVAIVLLRDKNPIPEGLRDWGLPGFPPHGKRAVGINFSRRF